MTNAPQLPSALPALWPLALEAAQDRAGVQALLLPGGAKSSRAQRRARSGRGKKKVTKKFVCHRAKWRHLNIFLVMMVALVEEPRDALGRKPPSAPRLQPLAGSTVPGLSSQAGRPEACASQQPLATDPCLQTQPGGGVGPA